MPTSRDGEHRTQKLLDKTLRARAERRTAGHSPAFAAAARALEAVEANYQLDLIERIELRNALVEELVELMRARAPAKSARPDKPPELWSQREGRKENPVAFIRRVYAKWLNQGLAKGDLRSLDPPLYQALAVWMHRHPEQKFPELESPLEAIAYSVESDAAIDAFYIKHYSRGASARKPRRK